ncbi:tRNA A64-2'-O-ribosylphosphate transferase [Microbotryomycetes sp. JL201]|nr:tRNA A64-2'-O-ribosylphosphate transferase [Microbotryomycetes sp. JL201]
MSNQRAGAWYVRPKGNEQFVYFKSTDGHAGEHDFSFRRTNLALVPVVEKHGGVLLVDSTRRGKRFPDALSKTVPLWCATMNAARLKLEPLENLPAAAKQSWAENGKLWTLPSAVGRSEHSQIEAKIDQWADGLLASSYNLEMVRSLAKPLRPLFVSPASQLSLQRASDFPDFYPVVCVSASKLASEEDGLERAGGYTYVQGSGDDHEEWSKGLTPDVFWANEKSIMAASRNDIDRLIQDVRSDTVSLASPDEFTIRSTHLKLVFGQTRTPDVAAKPHELVITTGQSPLPAEDLPERYLATRPGKVGYTAFFKAVGTIVDELSANLQQGHLVSIVAAQSDTLSDTKDLVVAVALILLARNFNDDGALSSEQQHRRPTKILIRARLQWILESVPGLNPSRNILTKTNGFLMSSSD